MGVTGPHPCLLPQAHDFARKLEALKPVFVEPRSKADFSEVQTRWALLLSWPPRAGRCPYQGLWPAAGYAWLRSCLALACCLLESSDVGMMAADPRI